jgi:hypothetical protein
VPTPVQHRSEVRALARLAGIDLIAIMGGVSSPDEAFAALMDTLPALTALYGGAAASMGADFYDEQRALSGASGRFSAVVADLPDEARFRSLASWSIGDLPLEGDRLAIVQSKAAGGLIRIVANADRDTIIGSAERDRAAQGWQRVTGPSSCGFCQMLAARGVVYTSRTVDFGAHDHCSCVAAPAFSGAPRPVQEFTPSERNISDAERARAREWMRQNGY